MSLLSDGQAPTEQGRHPPGPLICTRPPKKLIPVKPLICTKPPEKQKAAVLISTQFPFQYGMPSKLTGSMLTFKEETSLLLVMREGLMKAMENFKLEDVVVARLPFIRGDLEGIKKLKNQYLNEVEDLVEKYTGVVDFPSNLETWEDEVTMIGKIVKQHAWRIKDRGLELCPTGSFGAACLGSCFVKSSAMLPPAVRGLQSPSIKERATITSNQELSDNCITMKKFGSTELKAKVEDKDSSLLNNILSVKGQQETVQLQAINHNQPALIPATQAGLQTDLEIASVSGEVDNGHTLPHLLGEAVHRLQGEANLHRDGADHVPAWQDINLTAGLAGAGPCSSSKDIYPDSDLLDAGSQGGQQQLATLGLTTDVRLANGVLYQASDGEPDIWSVGLDVVSGDTLSPASCGVLQHSLTLRSGLQAEAGNAA